MVAQDWRGDLVRAYPDLFELLSDEESFSDLTDRIREVSDGWRDLMERACARIRAAVEAHGGAFVFLPLEKEGGMLRLYFSGLPRTAGEGLMWEAINLAEHRSACTCEVC